jgi:senataxin
LSISGQQRLKNIKSVDTLIVDEAGQAVEAETLIPMRLDPEKVLLIGDIQQLPATVISQDAEKLKFGRSLMERLIHDCSQPFEMLKIQYRMHPEISFWPSQKYYEGKLKNHESVCSPHHTIQEMAGCLPILSPYSFINIESQETKGPLGRSFLNRAEVTSTALIVNYLAQKHRINVEERVAIISFYSAQVSSIYETLRGKYPKIKVNTVDGFQGGENDIVIISCVRANREKQIGFLKQSKRLNVALTRARFSLIILGNQPTLMRSDIAELVSDADRRGFLFEGKEMQKLAIVEVKKPIVQSKWREDPSQQRMQADYKTQLCRQYALSSSCRYGKSCHYAHGNGELRLRVKKK